MQDTVTVFPDGRWQVLPVSWRVRGARWVKKRLAELTP
jgi:hypothetical protein